MTAPRPPVRAADGADQREGVNLVGLLEGEIGHGPGARLGLADVPRKLARGLEAAGVPYVAIPYRSARSEHSDGRLAAAPYATNVVCLNADYTPTFAADAGIGFFAGRYSIGVWFWETSVFRADELAALRFVDEVWVASDYVRRALEAARRDVPVRVVPLPAEAPAPPTLSREDLGLPPGFLFLFSFDWVSSERKNPSAVLDAFTRAFEPGAGPVLVLKSVNGEERKPQLLAELRRLARDRPDVRILDSHLEQEESNALMAACDCYVSLHRSEGFGLTLAEAISHGKPVIATGYSGNLEFMDVGTSYLVPYRLAPVPRGWWAYAPGAEWAEPDVDAASALMREVYDDPTTAAARGLAAREELLRRFSVERTARFLCSRLEAVERRHEASSTGEAHLHLLEASRALAQGVGLGLGRAGSRRPVDLGRRLLARALWPLLTEQHRLDSSLADALVALRRSLDDVTEGLAGRSYDDLALDEPDGDVDRGRHADTEARLVP